MASDLRAHLPLWRAAYFGPESDADIGLVLRDLDDGVLNMSTLYLLPEPGRLEELEALAQQWGADDQDRVTVFGLDRQEALRLWWD